MSELSGQLQVLKNKVKFRELIKELPDFYFKQISIEEIQRLSDDEIRFHIKPAVGFF
jgi:hypothetical protein